MAGVKISVLPAIALPALTDVFPIVQAGVTYKETINQLATLISPSISGYLPLAGGTMTGNIVMGANSISFASGYGINDVNNGAVIGFIPATTPVNYFTMTNSATGDPLSLASSGTDTNIIMKLDGKGTGGIAIKGSGTNDNASAGYVGEFISSLIATGSAVALTSGAAKTITSISLTAGDWDVWANVGSKPAAGTTTSGYQFQISNTNNSTVLVSEAYPYVSSGGAIPANGEVWVAVGPGRISLAATTTIYIVANVTFAVSTMAAYGFIAARRVR